MFDDARGFLNRSFLARVWSREYEGFKGSEAEAALLERLRLWSQRADLGERSSEAAFIQTFFVETWGYALSGAGGGETFSAFPQFTVPGAGQTGAAGAADLALGLFTGRAGAVPQVLCEFKDVGAGLDRPQARKGNTRSPVKQCLDYLMGARRDLIGHEPIQPRFGVVTDMNEFRLYWWVRGDRQFLRFKVREDGFLPDLLHDDDQARFDRFLFWRLFHRDSLIATAGPPGLEYLIRQQGEGEQKLEGQFYADYKAVRERLFNVLMAENQDWRDRPAQLLRLAQKILDRFIFVFYAEDMGHRMLFPPQLVCENLKERSRDRLYDPMGDDLWRTYKRLFQALNTGGPFAQVELRQINGGLFRDDPEIEGLTLSNQVFCAPGQGINSASIKAHPNTLLHLGASYDYAATGSADNSISLYTLGRIFEQSITALEIEEARLEQRLSLAEKPEKKLPGRKAAGVYYTPEWVVERLVSDALDPWFAARRAEVGWTGDAPPSAQVLEAYAARVAAVRVVDPACGSGAFLIGAFRRLLQERQDIETFRRAQPGARRIAVEEAELTRAILENNLFGVDISASAVEIAKLALWLHSARADAPLSSLDETIRCGNSLVSSAFWIGRPPEDRTPAAEERVNAFDWATAFPFADDPGRFDIVVGNPPYVKLQHFKKVEPQVAAYLRETTGADHYASTRTGNYDLYLPFIEKGLRLLRPGGRMAYIAPSLWPKLEQGEGLRTLVSAGRHLERWTNFQSHQIFRDAMVYTALQVFTAEPTDAVAVAEAPNGQADVADIDWTQAGRALDWAAVGQGAPWLLITGEPRRLIDRLAATCLTLGDRSVTSGVIVGLQTSLDYVYHLERLGDGRYRCTPRDGEPQKGRPHTPPYEVEIEDAIMHPLVSGREAKRYQDPQTGTFILFPYQRDDAGVMALIATDDLAENFPNAWAHLRRWEDALRAREGGKADTATWWRYVYPKNLARQDKPKVIVPRLVAHLKAAMDKEGAVYLDNVDVGGVIATRPQDASYLTGILNGPVADFVFRRTSKPFNSDYLSANKQFIEPLPVPRATEAQKRDVGARAQALQTLHTRRRDRLAEAAARLSALGRRTARDATWLWPDLESLDAIEAALPAALRAPGDRRDEARRRFDEAERVRFNDLQSRLDRLGSAKPSVEFVDGELRLVGGGGVLLGGVFEDADVGALMRAWWLWLIETGWAADAASLSVEMRKGPPGAGSPAARQFIAKVDELVALSAEIATAEQAINALLFDLYGLTPRERDLVLAG